MDAIFKGIFDNELTQVIEVGDFLLCLGGSRWSNVNLPNTF